MFQSFSSVPGSQTDSVAVSQHEQYQDSETEAVKWKTFISLVTPVPFLLPHVNRQKSLLIVLGSHESDCQGPGTGTPLVESHCFFSSSFKQP